MWQFVVVYSVFAVLYVITVIGALLMMQTGLKCENSKDNTVQCADDHYLCSWLCVMSFCQFVLLQPCFSSCFCCFYVFLLIWAGIGAVHLHMYYADNESCSTSVVDLTWYAVIYSSLHAAVLISVVSLI